MTGEQRRALRGHLGPVKAVAFMSTGRELVTGSWDGTVRLWNLESDRPVRDSHASHRHPFMQWPCRRTELRWRAVERMVR